MRHGPQIDPPNRFEQTRYEADYEHWEWDREHLDEQQDRRIEYIDDKSQSIVSENDSPDIPFRYSVNPYRGCVHGCAYCYARNTHEYLGFNAGRDFETRILVKHDAPQLLRDFLSNDRWQPEPIVFSGVTDCYQPAERQFQLTRSCLEVLSESRLPVGIVTKNALVARDRDILGPLAAANLARVFISITTLDPQLARDMEPRTSIPSARLRAIELLTAAGIPVGVMVAPVIPGLNDSEIPEILKAAAAAGAVTAGTILLRLPLTVEPVFQAWLQQQRPAQQQKLIGRLRHARDGQLNNAEWGTRMRGTGELADQIRNLFQVFARKYKLDQHLPAQSCAEFRPPKDRHGQGRLF